MGLREATSRFVEDYYATDLSERDSAESKWFLAWLKNINGGAVLSIGCGPNLLDDALFFQHLPTTLVGIDVNQSNIDFIRHSTHPELQKCRDVLIAQHVNVELLVGDIFEQRKEFLGRFDAIYAMGVIGMYDKQRLQNLLKLIGSYLKPSGIFLDIDWTECKLPKPKLDERKSFNWYDTSGPSTHEIGELLKANGFSIAQHEVYSVKDPEEYGWGKIYAYFCSKS